MATVIIKGQNSQNQAEVDDTGHLLVTGTVDATNPSVGENGEPAPGSSTGIGAVDPDGNLAPLKVNEDGELITSGTSTVTGSVVPAGLRTAGRITTMLVSTSALALPVVPLANRNAMSITNLSNEVLYLGFSSSVTADSIVGITAGWEIGPNEGFNIDITNNIPIYGIAAVGPVLIKIMELS